MTVFLSLELYELLSQQSDEPLTSEIYFTLTGWRTPEKSNIADMTFSLIFMATEEQEGF